MTKVAIVRMLTTCNFKNVCIIVVTNVISVSHLKLRRIEALLIVFVKPVYS